MWSRGTLIFDGLEVAFSVKHFEEGSHYGIDSGRISKLWVSHQGKCLINYDRGWDIRPKGALAQQAFKAIMRLYN